MSGLFGWIGCAARDEPARRTLDAMAATVGPGAVDRVHVGRHGAVAVVGEGDLAVERSDVDADSGAPGATAHAAGLVAAIRGRVRFDDAQLEAMAAELGPARALLHGYRAHGRDVLAGLRGEFSVAVLGDDGASGLLATDRIGGRRPIVYREHDGAVVFGPRAGAVHRHPFGRSPVDPQSLFDYLYFHMVPAPRTIRRGIRRLMPATALECGGGRSTVETYWRATFRTTTDVPLEKLEREFLDTLAAAVARGADGVDAIGCFLSGGTDSSTIAGLLRRARGSARTYSIGFEAEGYDEMEYARVVARHFETDHHEFYVKPADVVALVPEVAAAYADPFGNASAVPTLFCARAAREDGVRRLLAGDGGDELFAGNERYAKQHVFEVYHRVPRVLREALLEPALERLPGVDAILPLRKARSYVRQARVPMPRRLQTYNFLERFELDRVFEPEFLASVDREEPLDLQDAVYHAACAETLLDRMLALDLVFTIADSDLPKVTRMCEIGGVDVTYPMLDDDVVEFSTRVPPRLKLRGRKLRWFMKHALREFLPRETLTKPKQGFGLPFGVWLATDPGLRDLARDSLDGVRSRGVVRAAFVDEVEALHREDHAAYYGVLIWILMMLEQWYRAHEDVPAPVGDPAEWSIP